jgi:hypothetical protein
MGKRGRALFVLFSLVMALAISGVASAATYEGFTATLHEAYEGSD